MIIIGKAEHYWIYQPPKNENDTNKTYNVYQCELIVIWEIHTRIFLIQCLYNNFIFDKQKVKNSLFAFYLRTLFSMVDYFGCCYRQSNPSSGLI